MVQKQWLGFPCTLALAALVLGAGCTGSIGNVGEGPGGPGPGPDGRPNDPNDPNVPPPLIAECDSSSPRHFEERGLRKLTQLQYNNTVRDLLGDTTAPGERLGDDDESSGYPSNSVTAVDDTLFEAYFDVSATLASQAMATHGDEWMPCDHEDTACVSPFFEDFLPRAYRRPVSADELADVIELYEAVRDGAEADGDDGVESAITAVLLAPEFVYTVELGEAPRDGTTALTQHEVAAGLSYFIWNTMPDDELRLAADEGQLETPAQIEAQVRRMLEHEWASDTIGEFHRRWIHVRERDEIVRDADLFPWWNDALADALDAETRGYFEYVFSREGATLEDLFTSTSTVGNDVLAEHYGAAPPDADGRIDLDPSQRSGFLTMGGWLASQARPTQSDWIHRGLVVRRQVLCGDVDVAPDDADFTRTENDTGRIEDPQCGYCHIKMDPIGKGLDRYDATGRFVEGAVDTVGEMFGADQLGLPVEFDGALELAEQLSTNDAVHACYAEQWFRYASGRALRSGDTCQVHDLGQSFIESGGDIRELLVGITLMETFRLRSEGSL